MSSSFRIGRTFFYYPFELLTSVTSVSIVTCKCVCAAEAASGEVKQEDWLVDRFFKISTCPTIALWLQRPDGFHCICMHLCFHGFKVPYACGASWS